MADFQAGDLVVIGYSTVAKILSYDLENNRLSAVARAGGNGGENRIEGALSHFIIERAEDVLLENLQERPAQHAEQQVEVQAKTNPNPASE